MMRLRLVLACCLFFVGCSVDVSVSLGGSDASQTAIDLIEGELADQAGLGILIAECDEVDDPQPGDTFECAAQTEAGDIIRFIATMEDEETVDVESVNLVTPEGLDLIEQLAVETLEENVGETLGRDNFDCGDGGLVIEPGGTIDCVLTDPASGTRYDTKVTVEVLDPVEIFIEVGDPQ